ncbi:hypothetical protein [Priestia megaterium]|uniref:hypothetical protein n=1 Tax=Priestia megaterium TaxID=1404 RepID=UPI002E1C0A1C|nr:hypothetical protein [Priestia megaterium]
MDLTFPYQKFEEDIPTIEEVEVFQVGTWRGTEYKLEDLKVMESNFKALQGVLDPPLKVDHSESAHNIAGWVVNVYVKGKSLFVDLEVTEPDVMDKIKRGTFKKVSAEIYTSYTDESTLTYYGMVLRAISIVSIPQLKNIKGIDFKGGRQS